MPTKVQDVDRILKTYETAKIVIILDTHCELNGRFIYAGSQSDPASYEACSLKEVRSHPTLLRICLHACRFSMAAYLQAFTSL